MREGEWVGGKGLCTHTNMADAATSVSEIAEKDPQEARFGALQGYLGGWVN